MLRFKGRVTNTKGVVKVFATSPDGQEVDVTKLADDLLWTKSMKSGTFDISADPEQKILSVKLDLVGDADQDDIDGLSKMLSDIFSS